MSKLGMWATLAVVILALLAGAITGWKRALRAEGARDEALKSLVIADSLARVATARVDTIYREKVVTATKWQTRFDTARVEVIRRITDTLTVERFIQIADSTVGALRAECDACAKVNGALRVELGIRDSVISTMRAFTHPKQRSALGFGASLGPCLAWDGVGAKPAFCVGAGLVWRVR